MHKYAKVSSISVAETMSIQDVISLDCGKRGDYQVAWMGLNGSK